jgi:hypothetical protein
MLCGRCCATELPSRPVLQLDIFIEILLRTRVNKARRKSPSLWQILAPEFTGW